MQQISLFLSSVPIDQENPSMEIVQLSSTLPILSNFFFFKKKKNSIYIYIYCFFFF